MRIISVFNHKGGVGKTTMIYNLACRLAERGNTCLIIDADPQCNATSVALSEKTVGELYEGDGGVTIFSAVSPLLKGTGDIADVHPIKLDGRNVYILPGDLFLGEFEDVLAREWNNIFKPEERAVRFTSSLYRIAKRTGASVNAEFVLFDLGPSIGPLNQFALLSCDAFIVPVTPDIYSVRAMTSVGSTLKRWVEDYHVAKPRIIERKFGFDIPEGQPKFVGYVPQQFGIYRDNPTEAFQQWITRLEGAVRDRLVKVLAATTAGSMVAAAAERRPKLSELQNYHSLVPAAQTARCPIFALRGNVDVNPGHMGKVRSCGEDYDKLVKELEKRLV